MRIIAHLFITVITLLLLPEVIPGIVASDFYSAFIAAIILGIVNITLRPILFLLTLPITILTLGLFSFVVNAFLFWFVSTFIEGFTVDGLLPALLGATILSLVNWFFSRLHS